MKNYIILLLTITSIIIYSCSGGESGDKKAKLAELKKQQADITSQIKALEKELKDSLGEGNQNGRMQIVQVAAVEPKGFSHFIEVQGMVDSDKNVKLSPKSQGVVTKIYVTEGQQVKKGQLLAAQDAGIILQSIAQAKSGLELATTMFEKQQRLWDKKIGSEVQYLQAKNQKESAEAGLATLQEQYALTLFKAPFDGIVDEIDLRVGETPNPMTGGIRVVNTSDFKVVAEISEFYIDRVKQGADVIVRIPDLNKEIKAKVNSVSRTINQVNRTFMVEVSFPATTNLKPNMIAYLSINDYQNPKAITVPLNAIQESDEGKFVFVAENNKAKKKPVEVGQTYKGEAEVKTGLQAGEQVITIGQSELVDGQPIEISVQG